MANDVIEPTVVSLLAKLKQHGFWLGVSDQISNEHCVLSNQTLLDRVHLSLRAQEVFLNANYKDLLLEVLQA